MEPLEGHPVSSPDPAIISSVEQQASSSTHAISDMLASSPSVMTHTTHIPCRKGWSTKNVFGRLGSLHKSPAQEGRTPWYTYLTLQPNVYERARATWPEGPPPGTFYAKMLHFAFVEQRS